MITTPWEKVEAMMPYQPMEPDPATERTGDCAIPTEVPDNFTDTDPWLDPPAATATLAERIYRVSLRLALVVTLVACFIRLLELDPTGRIAKYLWFAGVGLAAAAAGAFVAMGAERRE